MDATGSPAGVSIAGQAVVVFEATLSL
jgi:hypothetical protein